jgi:hypothetical protein
MNNISNNNKNTLCSYIISIVFREHNWHKHHIYRKQEEDQSPYVDYIVSTMSDSLYDQTIMPKFSQVITMSNKTDGKYDDPKLSKLYNLVISSTIPIVRTCLGSFKSLITTW